jgi:hypothetical protein
MLDGKEGGDGESRRGKTHRLTTLVLSPSKFIRSSDNGKWNLLVILAE